MKICKVPSTRRIYVPKSIGNEVFIVKKLIIDVINDLHSNFFLKIYSKYPELAEYVVNADLSEVKDLLNHLSVGKKVRTVKSGYNYYVYADQDFNVNEEVVILSKSEYEELIKSLIKVLMLYSIYSIVKKGRKIEETLKVIEKTKETLRKIK